MLGKTTPFQQKLLKSLSRSSRSNEGITLLESLVAIIVLTIAVTVVTPPIFLAVATRVQNRKAEQAMHLAQKYTDRVRGLVEEGNYDRQSDNDSDDTGDKDRDEIPAQYNGNNAPTNDPRQIGPPTGPSNFIDSPSSNCNNFNNFTTTNMPAWNQALQVDVDGDCEVDFFVQIFRSSLQQVRENEVVAFPMGVRVYNAVAIDNNFGSLCDPSTNNNIPECPNNLNNNPGRLEASLGPTTGFNEQTRQPLAVKYADIIYSEDGSSLNWHRALN